MKYSTICFAHKSENTAKVDALPHARFCRTGYLSSSTPPELYRFLRKLSHLGREAKQNKLLVNHSQLKPGSCLSPVDCDDTPKFILYELHPFVFFFWESHSLSNTQFTEYFLICTLHYKMIDDTHILSPS